MKTIWKYEITPALNEIEIPINAEFLSLHTKNGLPCMWFLVETENSREFRRFEVYGTGHEINVSMFQRNFIGTFLVNYDSLVFHVFEKTG